jgi:hypothetical protein
MSESTNKKKNEVHDEDYLDSIVITAPHSHVRVCDCVCMHLCLCGDDDALEENDLVPMVVF